MKKIDTGISAIVPVFNAQLTIHELCERLKHVLGVFKDYEIILVDDKSVDTSLDIAIEIAKNDEHTSVIALQENAGQQCAILCGLRYAKYEYTVIIDDDLEQNPEDIQRLYDKMQEGYDVVYGVPEYNSLRNVGSIMRDVLFKLLTKIPRGIKVSSFRMMNSQTRNAIIRADTKYVYISMEILKYSQKIANVKIDRGQKSQSNYSFLKLIRLYKDIFLTYNKCRILKKHKQKGCGYKVDRIIRGGNR